MRAAKTRPSTPVTSEARERLRDQQRQEAVRLDAVIAAQRRLAAQRETADRAIARAEQGVAVKQAELDRAVVTLLETSGISRVALLLGRTEADLARVSRAERHRLVINRGGDPARTGVSA